MASPSDGNPYDSAPHRTGPTRRSWTARRASSDAPPVASPETKGWTTDECRGRRTTLPSKQQQQSDGGRKSKDYRHEHRNNGEEYTDPAEDRQDDETKGDPRRGRATITFG
jgi:hypothetical protein